MFASDSASRRGKTLAFSAASKCRIKDCKNQLRINIPLMDDVPTGDTLITIKVEWNGVACEHDEDAAAVNNRKDGLTKAQADLILCRYVSTPLFVYV